MENEEECKNCDWKLLCGGILIKRADKLSEIILASFKVRREVTITCPMCGKSYIPIHPSKAESFHSGDLESREQWLSGICSNQCWDEFLKFGEGRSFQIFQG